MQIKYYVTGIVLLCMYYRGGMDGYIKGLVDVDGAESYITKQGDNFDFD